MMGRPGSRATLEQGLKLDINRLARNGFIRPGHASGPIGIRWTSSYWGEIASGTSLGFEHHDHRGFPAAENIHRVWF